MRLLISLLAFSTVSLMAATPKAAPAGDPAHGKEVFTKRCISCHNPASTERRLGPGLKALFTHSRLKSGEPLNEANVLKLINEGVGGMPAYGQILKADEKAHLIAYLKTL